jgi:hypothetical protein
MQALLAEYRRSLKLREAEEFLDLYFYRPVGFLLVKGIYRLPITPNGVTVLSLAAGLVAAWMISTSSFVAAAAWYAAANILDCSDGQLARLQKSGTPLGRLVDGVADYVSSVAIFLSCGICLARGNPLAWGLVVAGGISSAVHALYFDFYQAQFIAIVRGEENFANRELARFAPSPGDDRAARGGVAGFFIRLYVRYLRLQIRTAPNGRGGGFDPDRYRTVGGPLIRAWSLLGPTTNRSLLIICLLFGTIAPFLWIAFTLGNIWLVICIVRQRGLEGLLSEEQGAGRSPAESQTR